MNPQYVVLDSGVFVKIFLDEDGHDDVIALLEYIGSNGIVVVCPDIFLYEVLSVSAKYSLPLKPVLESIRSFENSYLHLMPLTARQLEAALHMAEDGHPKSGFPSIYDSSYHCMALAYRGVFITADDKHLRKTEKYGSAVHLKEWNTVFSL